MPTTPRHKIVTVQRGHDEHGHDTYAARCEYEHNGQTHLCAITFGGYPTRTAARHDCKRACTESRSQVTEA